MSGKRPEPFVLVLTELYARLRSGAYAADDRLVATEIAAELALSATPVREALSRLAGEGLLEDRRGQGYFVRRLGARDLADLYRLSLAHLAIALDGAAPAWRAEASVPTDADGEDPVEAVEQLFAAWVNASGGRHLTGSFARLQVVLGPARRMEGVLIEDLDAERRDLAGLDPHTDRSARLARLRAFHARRVRLAAQLAELLERRRGAAQ